MVQLDCARCGEVCKRSAYVYEHQWICERCQERIIRDERNEKARVNRANEKAVLEMLRSQPQA